ncbi:uncharacterized protein LOC127791345 isoform X2 [Diospyros lotus]|uniref:uncharacterized protein LOC127791345 isoform X2 n=1 Tax=Diospyros lotus TaxID=55363 RepID=UPI002250AA26|nr:uncharacterized protein LOC127791345 isoform X2 [Diospyros lotus]
MDPCYEQVLRNEVMYLHSLWRQGPPRNPNSSSIPLQPSNPTHFKKTGRGSRGKKSKNRQPKNDPPAAASAIEWPCNSPTEPPPLPESGWPSLKLPPAATTRLPSAEEQARFAAMQLQQKALKAAQEFLASCDSDGENCMDEDGDDNEDEDKDGSEEYRFFVNVFAEDDELRGYYEKNFEGGEFCCLVCGGIRHKVGKIFKSCVSLVQHSISIVKTKKKRAHRAFAQVICKVLGWDLDRLPTIVSSLAGNSQGNSKVGVEQLKELNKSSSSGNATNGELDLKECSNVCQEEELLNSSVDASSNLGGDNVILCEGNDAVGMEDLNNQTLGLENVNNGELVPESVSNVGWEEELQNANVPGTPTAIGNDMMLCEGSSMVGDENKCEENLENQNFDAAEGKPEGAVSCLCRNLSRTMVLERNSKTIQREP